MTKKIAAAFFIAVVLVVVAVAVFLWLSPATAPTPTAEQTSVDPALVNPVVVVTPQPNVTITSPLTVLGQAKGTWFFEGSFPVELRSADGVVIAQGVAAADGDWMTENFVPFSVTLTFTPPATGGGELILRKDNPSGDPEKDAQVAIPVVW